jgi:hypothetical protein
MQNPHNINRVLETDGKKFTFSRYERGLHLLPADKALKILQIWQRKAKTD